MTTQKSKENKSRRRARKLAKDVYLTLLSREIIHHKDIDPLNNDLSNLVVMDRYDHMVHHYNMNRNNPNYIKPEKKQTIPRINTILKDLLNLESWLSVYNNTYVV